MSATAPRAEHSVHASRDTVTTHQADFLGIVRRCEQFSILIFLMLPMGSSLIYCSSEVVLLASFLSKKTVPENFNLLPRSRS